MFNNIFSTFVNINKALSQNNNKTCSYKSLKINSCNLNCDVFIHTGNSLIWRKFSYLFIGRQNKFNVFFKKPLVRPTKRKKK